MKIIVVEGREAGSEMDRLAWLGMGYIVLEGERKVNVDRDVGDTWTEEEGTGRGDGGPAVVAWVGWVAFFVAGRIGGARWGQWVHRVGAVWVTWCCGVMEASLSLAGECLKEGAWAGKSKVSVLTGSLCPKKECKAS